MPKEDSLRKKMPEPNEEPPPRAESPFPPVAQLLRRAADELDDQSDNRFMQLLVEIERRSGIDRQVILTVLAASVCYYLVFGECAELLCKLIGTAYPAATSLNILANHDNTDATHVRVIYWLRYWICYAFVQLISFYGNRTLQNFPVFWLAKSLLFVWLHSRTFQGAQRVYEMCSFAANTLQEAVTPTAAPPPGYIGFEHIDDTTAPPPPGHHSTAEASTSTATASTSHQLPYPTEHHEQMPKPQAKPEKPQEHPKPTKIPPAAKQPKQPTTAQAEPTKQGKKWNLFGKKKTTDVKH